LAGGALAGGALAGGAAADFLHEHPTPFEPGNVQPGVRPGTGDLALNRPTTRPGGDGLRPGDFTRPGQDGGGIQRPTRPGEGGGGVERPTRPGEVGGGTQRPSRPGEGGGGTQRPTRPGENGGGIRPDRPGGPGEDGGGIRPDRPSRPGQGGSGEQWRPGDWANHRPDRIPDRDRWNNWRENNFTQINNYWNNSWRNHDHWFDNDWCDHHHIHWPYYPNFNYWGWATWPAFTTWFPTWGWSQPVYYNYGDNVYYEDNQVYYGDQPVATAEQYAQQAAAIATNMPDTQPAAEDWMPLGVFAITSDGEPTGSEPTQYLQLAVSKQGIINGTIQNTATDSAQSIEGMVDKQTQRAAWTVKGKSSPIMETGIGNLTKDTAPALVHFADGTTQQWLLVRLDQPKEGATPQTN
jgi:hypothetical protein